MERRFHLFVSRYPQGHLVSVPGHPHLSAFAEEPIAARADLARVLRKLIAEGAFPEELYWPDLKLRKVELTIRAMQQGRIIPVPMRFSVLIRSAERVHKGATPRKGTRGGLHVHVPRLGETGIVHDPQDLEAYVEELIRHALHLAPLTQLRAVNATGEEYLDTLNVTLKAGDLRRKERKEERRPRSVPEFLGQACARLNDQARAGVLSHAYQRDREVQGLAERLLSGARTSTLLVGPASVGKTAILHELVYRMIGAPADDALHGLEVFSTSGGRIIAGMRYLGEWQERLHGMISELRTRRAVLHFDSLAELLGTFGTDTGLSIVQQLLPAIEGGEIVVVVEATPEDVARAERTHAHFVHAFRRFLVSPLDLSETRLALGAVARRIAKARRVQFTDDALERVLDLAERFGDGLLGAAADLLQGATVGTPAETPSPEASANELRDVTASEVLSAFVSRTGYPRALVDPGMRLDPEAVLQALRERIVGQDAATLLLRDMIVTLKAGLVDPRRPLGTFLLLGPTGVGKTESALALTAYLFGDEARLARFDMSEYSDWGSAQRLLGTGSGRSGGLTGRVREQPFGVVLLDEIEKADAGVLDLLLQVMGEGRLTDVTGRTVSFRNTVLLLTSNLGADTLGRTLGFGGRTAEHLQAHYLGAAVDFFRPEFINRLDQVVPYQALSEEAMVGITRRLLDQAFARPGLTRRGVRVEYGPDLVRRLLEVGFDPRYGARPLKRAIEQWVMAPLAQRLAAAGESAPEVLRIQVAGDGTLAFTVQ